MKLFFWFSVTVVTVLFGGSTAYAESGESILYQADFNDGVVPEPFYERFPKMRVQDGVLVVTQGKRHAASPTLPVPFEAGELRFRFRISPEVELFTCRFEEASRVEGAQAHLGRLEFRGGEISLKVDSPPKDREHRQASVLATAKNSLARNEWHEVAIRFEGSVLSATINDDLVLEGTHPHFGEVKIGTFFVLRGGELQLDDLKLTSRAKSKSMVKAPANLEQSLAIFHDYVEPLLTKNCYECHSHEAKKAKGGLVVDSLNPMLKGGDLGPALIPGDAEASLLYEVITYHDDDLQMPPDGKLDDLDITKVREWIELGAAHPRRGPELEDDEYSGPRAEELWSVQPFLKVAPPKGAEHPVDAFLIDALEEAGLAPSDIATPQVLLRRIHYVLTGLPPTPEETMRFMEQAESELDLAMEEGVDALLASPHFGERWGRHWLDVARYADVTGATNPQPYPEAWRFREWAIHSFNTDKRWDDFVREQLAGDLLPAGQVAQRTEQLLGTGYLALSHVLAIDRDRERLKLDTIDEQLDVIGRTFLGIQIGCARCHDHKIDPFPTADYYAMAGIFRSTNTVRASASQESVETEGAELTHRDDSLPVWLQGGKGVKIHSTSDAAEPRDEPIHLRGELDVLGDVIPRGFPTMLASFESPAIPPDQSGRVQLADYILHEENTLSARLIVNRVWQHVFGQGLVRSADNFGLTGDLPSHPELLDFLAIRFREQHNHSFKSLIRELLLTDAFRRSSRAREDGLAIDPENRLLWRANLRRSDAETLIDSIQRVAGTLDLKPAGYAVPEFKRGNQASTSELEIPRKTLRKRAVYWPVFRKDVPMAMDILSIFDFPPPTAPKGSRDATRVPSQSLALLNSPLVLNAARALQDSLPEGDDETRLQALHLKVLARVPNKAEQETALYFLSSFSQGIADAEAAKPENVRSVAWNRLSHTLLVSNEFITIP